MKKFVGLFFWIFIATNGFANHLILNNQATKFIINKKSKMAIQWAASAKEIEEKNILLMDKKKWHPKALSILNRVGKNNIDIPKNAEYFRVLAWSNDEKTPDLLTSWVDVVPKKTYTLKEDLLIPIALMAGMGC